MTSMVMTGGVLRTGGEERVSNSILLLDRGGGDIFF